MKNNLSYISGLQIDIELMMYGYVGFRMSQIDEGIMTEWIAVADGGEVFADEAMVYSEKKINSLSSFLEKMELPDEEDDFSSRVWGLTVIGEDGILLEQEHSNWPTESLELLVSEIERILGDSEATSWVHNILQF